MELRNTTKISEREIDAQQISAERRVEANQINRLQRILTKKLEQRASFESASDAGRRVA